jgi:hypothetical protein
MFIGMLELGTSILLRLKDRITPKKLTTEYAEFHGGKEWISDKNPVFLRVLRGFSSLFVIAHISMFSLSKVLAG